MKLNDHEVARLYQIGKEYSTEAYELIRRLHRYGVVLDPPDILEPEDSEALKGYMRQHL